MGIGTNPDFAEAFAAALDWWREAGVDATFVDEPRTWLAPPDPKADDAPSRKRAAPAPKPQEAAPVVDIAPTLPQDIDSFRDWWMTSPDLDSGRVSGRVPPRGATEPAMMIVAAMPESGDSQALLSGPEGKLLDMFLKMAGLSDDTIYRASVLPCHSPGADWDPATNRPAMSALVQHIALVRPKRLLVIGFNILPLLQHASAQGPAVSSVFNHEGATIPMLAVRRIPAPASQPRWKCVLWRAWLDWTGS